MVVTIYSGYDNTYMTAGCRDMEFKEEFEKKFGKLHEIHCSEVYKKLKNITDWCKDELGEECQFEVG